jgi:hypothetical protein
MDTTPSYVSADFTFQGHAALTIRRPKASFSMGYHLVVNVGVSAVQRPASKHHSLIHP